MPPCSHSPGSGWAPVWAGGRDHSAIMAAAPDATEVAGRREAIAEAIRIAKAGDIILVAGKGHETGQIVGDRVLPFDDALVARECAA